MFRKILFCFLIAAASAAFCASAFAAGRPQCSIYKQESAPHFRSMNELPDGVARVMSEKKHNRQLAAVIVSHFKIPKEYILKTKYYYNYVDFDGDGRNEIFAVAVGPYTSGSGGDSAVIVRTEPKLSVIQSFTLINTPVIITESGTGRKGVKDIVTLRSGGGAKREYVTLHRRGGRYNSVSDALPMKDFKHLKGTAIICNDFAGDNMTGKSKTLADMWEK